MTWKNKHSRFAPNMAPMYGLFCGGSGRKAGFGVRNMNWTEALMKKRMKEQLGLCQSSGMILMDMAKAYSM